MAYVSGSSTTSRSSSSSSFYIQDLGTAEFYGLQVVDSVEDLVIPNQNFSSKPSILIEGSTIVIDYSDTLNEKDRNFIDILFNSMNSDGGTFSTGFTLTNAIYNDPTNNYTADLSASITLNNYSKFKILGTFSAIGLTMETNFYHPEFFEGVPQITSAVGLTGATLAPNVLVNYGTSDSTSFAGNDFQTGDYVDFDTTENVGRFTIAGISTDGLSREQLTFLDGDPLNLENLKGQQVILGHSRRVFNVSSPTSMQQQNTQVFRVGTSIVDGKRTITIDDILNKNLILSRGVLHLFILDNRQGLDFSLSSQPVRSGTPLGDNGIYSVTDGTLDKTYIFFVPNSSTPDNVYYSSSNADIAGVGSIKITGDFNYFYNVAFTNNIGTGGNTAQLNQSFSQSIAY